MDCPMVDGDGLIYLVMGWGAIYVGITIKKVKVAPPPPSSLVCADLPNNKNLEPVFMFK